LIPICNGIPSNEEQEDVSHEGMDSVLLLSRQLYAFTEAQS
jgi:hypothetical protein